MGVEDELRWPRGAPDDERGHGQGGRWASALSAAMGAAGGALHGLMTHDQVASYLGRTDYEVFGHAGGRNGSVEFRHYSDGTMLAYKTILAFRDAPRQVQAEVETSRLGHALGARVAPVVADPEAPHHNGLLQQYIEGDLDPGEQFEAYDRTTHGPQAHMIGLLDALVGNADRHEGNMRFPDEGPVGIDHGGTFLADRYDGGAIRDVVPRDYGNGIHARIEDMRVVGHVQSYYSRSALEQARGRLWLAEQYVSPAHFAGVMRTLDHLISITPETGGKELGQ